MSKAVLDYVTRLAYDSPVMGFGLAALRYPWALSPSPWAEARLRERMEHDA